MNKKIFIMPIAICAMGLASCNGSNKGLSRHSFKESTSSAVKAIIEGLASKQWSGTVEDSNVTMQEKKVSLNGYNEINLNYSTNSINMTRKLSKTIKGSFDQDNKAYKINSVVNESNYFSEGISTQTNFTRGLKISDNKIYNIREIPGSKTKTEYGAVPEDFDFNTYIMELLVSASKQSPKINTYHIDILGSGNKTSVGPDLFGASTGNKYSFLSVFSGPLEKFDAKNLVKYGSNDEKSVMLAIKGNLSFEDFQKCWFDYNESTKYEGTVDFDYFFAIENCFVTQFEVSTKYNNCKVTYTDEGNSVTTSVSYSGDAYGKYDINYKSTESTDINLNDYQEGGVF